MTWIYRLIFIAGLLAATWAHGFMTGGQAKQNKALKKDIKTQTVRAEHAEKQRDIANAPPASVDDMLEWLSGDDR